MHIVNMTSMPSEPLGLVDQCVLEGISDARCVIDPEQRDRPNEALLEV